MKRLFIRIFALVALVVLGLIAIAQAQRGADPSKTDEAASLGNTNASSQGVSALLPAPANPSLMPPLGSLGQQNPLRPSPPAEPREPTAVEVVASDQGPRDSTPAEPPLAQPPVDPLAQPRENPLRAQTPADPLAQRGANPLRAQPPYRTAPPDNQGPPIAMPATAGSSAPPYLPGLPNVPSSRLTSVPSGIPAAGRAVNSIPAFGPMPRAADAVVQTKGETSEANSPVSVGNTLAPGGDRGIPAVAIGPLAAANPLPNPGTPAAQLGQGSTPVEPSAFPPRRSTDPPDRPTGGVTTTAERGEPAPLDIDPRAAPSTPVGPYAAAQNDFGTSRMINEPRAANGPVIEQGSSAEGPGMPGGRQLEGPQAPQLTIQKFAPPAIQVGKTATFRVTVANRGTVPAHGVQIHDQVPKGTQLMGSKPRASRGADGELVWELGTLNPSDEVTVETQLMPVSQGEIGSVATLRFNAEASARSIATKPELIVKTSAPGRVLLGDPVPLSITISNPGTGEATGVVVAERVPAGLRFFKGDDLEYDVGTLKPGETRQIQLPLTASRPGRVTNLLSVHDDGSLRVVDRVTVEVLAAQLEVDLEGPKRRYLERQATYVMSVSNPGTAPAQRVELVAYLSRGLKFVSASDKGQYEPGNQTVHWFLNEVPANKTGKLELVTVPIEPGQQKLRLEGRADQGLAVEKEQPISVEGIAAVMFEITNLNDPIEVGAQTVCQIHVVNQGSKAAGNVRITALVPHGMRAVAAEGPTRYVLEPDRVQFESLAQLAPKAETTYRVRVQGLQPGDLRFRVQLLTDEMQEPVTKEESTRVYANE